MVFENEKGFIMSSQKQFISLLLVAVVCLSATAAWATTSDSASLYFSSSLINDRVSRSIDQTQPVNEDIMDTPIQGTTQLQGTIQSSLIPNSSAGEIQILLKARSTSQTTGRHWPVVIDDQSAGKLVGSIDIRLNGLDFTTDDEKAAADIHVTDQQVHSEIGDSHWILDIAEDKIRDSEPQANLDAEGLAEQKIRNQLKNQVTAVLKDARRQINSTLIDPLSKHGMRPHSVQFQTGKGWLVLTANWSDTKDTTTISTTGFDPSADLVAVIPEASALKIFNSFSANQVKTIAEMENQLSELTLPASWKQKSPLKLIKKEKQNGNLILQWSR